MKIFFYKGSQMLLKDLYALSDMNKSRVNRLLEHHGKREGDDVTEIISLSEWHKISTRKTGGRFLFRGERLTYTEIAERIPLGVRAITRRIKIAQIQFDEDVSHLFEEISDTPSPESEGLTGQVANLIQSNGVHPYQAWAVVKGVPSSCLEEALGVSGEHLQYYTLKASNSSSKTLSKVAVALGVSQAVMRESFEAYRKHIERQNKRYCEAVTTILSEDKDLLENLPSKISGFLCEGLLPVGAIKEYLNISNEDMAERMGLSLASLISKKKITRPQAKTVKRLSKVSGIEEAMIYQVFEVCRRAQIESR